MRIVSKVFLGIGVFLILGVVAIIWLISVLSAPKTDELLEKTMNTLEPSFVIATDAAAIDVVRKRTEVFKYELELSKAGVAASFRAEDRGEEWAVQVFEVVNQGDSSHTATLNWYIINKRTGNIEPEFSFIDQE